jgi:CMP/dCMP kinase
MTVITISRQSGSGGDEIAARVADLLGYQLFDRRIILQAAQEVGLSEQEIIDYSEENHKIRTFLDQLFGRTKQVTTARIWKDDPSGVRVVEEFGVTEESALALVQKAIKSAYKTGNMVIVGRAGQVILKDQPGVLHVRIEAPLEDRIQHLKQSIKNSEGHYQADVEIRRKAQDQITQRDKASSDYTRRFYQVEWADPLLYHMVLNTGRVGIEQAALLIVRMVRILEQEQLNPEPVA